ncbi:MAG: hypothetical protein O7H39_07325 [Gammaproteobacteria bacterium]|nr:hypothetical protein [Gammaproteobacteria bacterium]
MGLYGTARKFVILLARMQVRGASGVVTDGNLRDTPTIRDMDWPVYSGGAAPPTNLIHHHAIDLNVPIGCGGVVVYPGDILVGEGEGVVVIPKDLAVEVAKEAIQQEHFEDYVMERVRSGECIFGLYPPDENGLKGLWTIGALTFYQPDVAKWGGIGGCAAVGQRDVDNTICIEDNRSTAARLPHAFSCRGRMTC